MMIFSKNMKIVRSIQARIASYSASLLDARKSNSKLLTYTSSLFLGSVIHTKDPPVNITWVHVLLWDFY